MEASVTTVSGMEGLLKVIADPSLPPETRKTASLVYSLMTMAQILGEEYVRKSLVATLQSAKATNPQVCASAKLLRDALSDGLKPE